MCLRGAPPRRGESGLLARGRLAAQGCVVLPRGNEPAGFGASTQGPGAVGRERDDERWHLEGASGGPAHSLPVLRAEGAIPQLHNHLATSLLGLWPSLAGSVVLASSYLAGT